MFLYPIVFVVILVPIALGERYKRSSKLRSTPAEFHKRLASQGTCGNGSVGNAICEDTSLCCSEWGWCGSSRAYCRHHVTTPANVGTDFPTATSAPVATDSPTATTAASVTTETPTATTVPDTTLTPTASTGTESIVPATTAFPTATAVPAAITVAPTANAAPVITTAPIAIAATTAPTATLVPIASVTTSKPTSISTPVAAPVTGLTPTTSTPIVATNPTLAPASPVSLACGYSTAMTVNFGYYDSSVATNRTCNRLFPKDINVAGNHFTHLSYAFAGINASDQLGPSGDDFAGQVPQYLEFNALKTRHPGLKTLISIGDGILNYASFSELAASSTRRATFGSSVVAFLEAYGFDGVDVDWEYPGDTNGQPADIQNFPLLLKAIRDASNAAGKQILITIAIPVVTQDLSAGYNLKALSEQVDFFNIMAYDINGPWNETLVIGANTDLSSVKTSIQYMFQQGVPSNQMVLGLAAYGHSFYLTDPTCIAPGCNFTTGGPESCAGLTGDMAFFAIDQYVQAQNFDSLNFNPTTSSMEMVIGGNLWISFDNLYTFNLKASYAATTCMRGVMWWSVDQLASPIVLSALSP